MFIFSNFNVLYANKVRVLKKINNPCAWLLVVVGFFIEGSPKISREKAASTTLNALHLTTGRINVEVIPKQ